MALKAPPCPWKPLLVFRARLWNLVWKEGSMRPAGSWPFCITELPLGAQQVKPLNATGRCWGALRQGGTDTCRTGSVAPWLQDGGSLSHSNIFIVR